ncbi:MAG: hypothetical protein LBB81_10135 [Treponema sp.]|nr:hypothetical protein [Treponema sp.]
MNSWRLSVLLNRFYTCSGITSYDPIYNIPNQRNRHYGSGIYKPKDIGNIFTERSFPPSIHIIKIIRPLNMKNRGNDDSGNEKIYRKGYG